MGCSAAVGWRVQGRQQVCMFYIRLKCAPLFYLFCLQGISSSERLSCKAMVEWRLRSGRVGQQIGVTRGGDHLTP